VHGFVRAALEKYRNNPPPEESLFKFLQYDSLSIWENSGRRTSSRSNWTKQIEQSEVIMSSATNYIPEGFHSLTPYLVCNGASRVLEFLKQAFGAVETFRMDRDDGTIGHASARLGDSMVEMADSAEEWKAMPAGLHLYVPRADEVYKRAVEAGGQSLYEPRDMEYGDREGGIQDPSGNHWYIATHKAGKHFAPEGLRSVTPGMSVKDAARFLQFLVNAFAAKVVEKNEAANGVVGHAKVRIGDSVLECSEAHGKWGTRTATMHLYVPDVDAVYERVLKAGATSLSEPKDQFYGERSGGVTDGWGNNWYVATHQENLSREEVESRAKKSAG
jgi:PhnB protein